MIQVSERHVKLPL